MPYPPDAAPADRPDDLDSRDLDSREPADHVLVMGAALLHEGRVLAARRTSPPEARGMWEFPGGKVEPGESPEEALVREIAEELGCRVRVRGELEGEQLVKRGYVLRVAVAELVEGEPVPHEHDAVRWLRHDELDAVTWLAPDLPFLDEVAALLKGGY